MTKIFSFTQPIGADIVDAYCVLQKGFTDQFVYYRKDRPTRFMGMGRCIALPTLDPPISSLFSSRSTVSMRKTLRRPTSCSRPFRA